MLDQGGAASPVRARGHQLRDWRRAVRPRPPQQTARPAITRTSQTHRQTGGDPSQLNEVES